MLLTLCVAASAVYAAEEGHHPSRARSRCTKVLKPIDLPAPTYPLASAEGGEGWVILNLMVDPEGKPYEATVVESTGNPALEKAALEAPRVALRTGPMNGTPIDAGGNYKVSSARPARPALATHSSAHTNKCLPAVDER